MVNKKKLIRNGTLIVLLLLLVVVHFRNDYLRMKSEFKVSGGLPIEFSNLFKSDLRNKLFASSTWEMIGNSSFGYCEYNRKYQVYINKFGSSDKILFSRDIHESNGLDIMEPKSTTIYVPYFRLDMPNYVYFFHRKSQHYDNKLFLIFDCGQIDVLRKSDSIVCYSVALNHFSVKYNLTDKPVVQLTNLNEKNFSNFQIALIKKSSGVYMVLLTPMEKVQVLENNSILDLLN